MVKIPHYTDREVENGSIRKDILDAILERYSATAVSDVQRVIGGIGGGWDDLSVPASKGNNFLERERIVFRKKITALIDVLNGEAHAGKLESFLTPLLTTQVSTT